MDNLYHNGEFIFEVIHTDSISSSTKLDDKPVIIYEGVDLKIKGYSTVFRKSPDYVENVSEENLFSFTRKRSDSVVSSQTIQDFQSDGKELNDCLITQFGDKSAAILPHLNIIKDQSYYGKELMRLAKEITVRHLRSKVMNDIKQLKNTVIDSLHESSVVKNNELLVTDDLTDEQTIDLRSNSGVHYSSYQGNSYSSPMPQFELGSTAISSTIYKADDDLINPFVPSVATVSSKQQLERNGSHSKKTRFLSLPGTIS